MIKVPRPTRKKCYLSFVPVKIYQETTAKKPCILLENRGEIVALRELGLSYRKIVVRVGCSAGAACEVIKKYQQTGTVVYRPFVAGNRSPHNGRTAL